MLSLSLHLFVCLLSVSLIASVRPPSLTLHVLVHSFLSVSLSVFIPCSDHGLLSLSAGVCWAGRAGGTLSCCGSAGAQSMCSGGCPAPGCRCPPTSGATRRSWPRWCGDASCRSRPALCGWSVAAPEAAAAAAAARPEGPPGMPAPSSHTPEATTRNPGLQWSRVLPILSLPQPWDSTWGPRLWALGSLTHRSPWPELPPTPGLAALGLPLALCLHGPFSWVSHTPLCPVPHGAPQSICVLSPVRWFAHSRSHRVDSSLPLPLAHEVSWLHSLLLFFFFGLTACGMQDLCSLSRD